jgi:hypothetical protein
MPWSVPSGTSGLGWIDQLVPFQSSINGLVIPVAPAGCGAEEPTAKQTFCQGHEMPCSKL